MTARVTETTPVAEKAPPLIAQAIDDYIGELARRGLKRSSRDLYRTILDKFAEAHERDLLESITATDVRRYLDRWVNAEPSTLALRVTVLRGFFAFLRDEGVISGEPMRNIRRPRVKRPEDLDVVTVTAAEVARMIEQAEDWQELLCVSVLAYLGLRMTAAARLRCRDLDLEHGTVKAREKGGKVIVKPLPDDLVLILHAAWDSGDVDHGPDDFVIPSRGYPHGGERSPKVVYHTVRRIGDRVGVRVHPHAIRAAFAVHFDASSEDLVALKELLGHSRMETTMIYLRRKDRQAAMEKVRGLSYGSTVFPSDQPGSDRTPVRLSEFPAAKREGSEHAGSSPLLLKLEQLRAKSRARGRT